MNGDKEQWFMVFLVPILTEIRTDFSSQKAEKFVANNWGIICILGWFNFYT